MALGGTCCARARERERDRERQRQRETDRERERERESASMPPVSCVFSVCGCQWVARQGSLPNRVTPWFLFLLLFGSLIWSYLRHHESGEREHSPKVHNEQRRVLFELVRLLPHTQSHGYGQLGEARRPGGLRRVPRGRPLDTLGGSRGRGRGAGGRRRGR